MKPEIDRIGAKEQIAQRPPQQVSDPPLRQMVRAIVDEVAALAQAVEIAQPVITRIMIDVRRG
jgi:hypothetical protein